MILSQLNFDCFNIHTWYSEENEHNKSMIIEANDYENKHIRLQFHTKRMQIKYYVKIQQKTTKTNFWANNEEEKFIIKAIH